MVFNTLIISIISIMGHHVDSGFISQYAKSPTDGTLHYRKYESMEIEDIDYDAYIAVKDCSMIGEEVWLQLWYDDYESGPLKAVVFDCSGHVDTSEWMEEDNIIAEVDWYTARDHGFLGRGGVSGRIFWIGEEDNGTYNSSDCDTGLRRTDIVHCGEIGGDADIEAYQGNEVCSIYRLDCLRSWNPIQLPVGH